MDNQRCYRYRPKQWIAVESLLLLVALLATNSQPISAAGREHRQKSQEEASIFPKDLNFGQQAFNHPKSLAVVFSNFNDADINILNIYLAQRVEQQDKIETRMSTAEFYVSRVDERTTIPPQGNLTFDVVYLPINLGESTAELVINTTTGIFQYKTSGFGIDSPFQISPLVGIRGIPEHVLLTPDVVIFNPYDHPIRITEIYSSGGRFQLELPLDKSGGNRWLIDPYQRKSVIRLKFLESEPGKYSGFLRIKINCLAQNCPTDLVVVPIEIEVKQEHGLYLQNALLDMGTIIIAPELKRKKIELSLLHSKTKITANLISVSLMSKIIDDRLQLSDYETVIQFKSRENILELLIEPIKMMNNQSKQIFLQGTLILITCHHPADHNCKIQNALYIPIYAKFLKGSIFVSNLTAVVIPKSKLSATLLIRNDLLETLLIRKIILPVGESELLALSSIDDINKDLPVALQPGENFSQIISFDFSNISKQHFLSINSTIQIQTNVTHLESLLQCYTGILRSILPKPVFQKMLSQEHSTSSKIIFAYTEEEIIDQDFVTSIDFGVLPLNTLMKKRIIFLNENPVAVKLQWKSSNSKIPNFSILVLGCGRKNQFKNLLYCEELQPLEWIVFEIRVESAYEGDDFSAKFHLKTDYEDIEIPVLAKAKTGVLYIEDRLLTLQDCFPTKVCSMDVKVRSTFQQEVNIEKVISVQGHFISNLKTVIKPNMETNIGRIIFNPAEICLNGCYAGRKEINHDFQHLIEKDVDAFEAMAHSNLKLPFQLLTNQNRHYDFMATINLTWPKLIQNSSIDVVLLEDQETTQTIVINNPSSEKLHYELFIDNAYDLQEITPVILKRCESCSRSVKLTKNQIPGIVVIGEKQGILNPNEKEVIHVQIKANTETGDFSVPFFVRNNLTTLDGVWITVRTIKPQFKFGNRRPGSMTPLLFDISESNNLHCVSVSTKRSFTAKNYGHVPLLLSQIKVGNENCQGYGFKVLDCSDFVLLPNNLKKIEIEFTPDLTLARVSQLLYIEINAKYLINYTLLGTVPSYTLNHCGKIISRPWWEKTLKKIILILLVIVLIVLSVVAILDGYRILSVHEHVTHRTKGPFEKTLDFKAMELKLLSSQQQCRRKSEVANVVSKKKQSKRKVDTEDLFWSTLAGSKSIQKTSLNDTNVPDTLRNFKHETDIRCLIAKKDDKKAPKSKVKVIKESLNVQDASKNLPSKIDCPHPHETTQETLGDEKQTHSKTPGRERKKKLIGKKPKPTLLSEPCKSIMTNALNDTVSLKLQHELEVPPGLTPGLLISSNEQLLDLPYGPLQMPSYFGYPIDSDQHVQESYSNYGAIGTRKPTGWEMDPNEFLSQPFNEQPYIQTSNASSCIDGTPDNIYWESPGIICNQQTNENPMDFMYHQADPFWLLKQQRDFEILMHQQQHVFPDVYQNNIQFNNNQSEMGEWLNGNNLTGTSDNQIQNENYDPLRSIWDEKDTKSNYTHNFFQN